MNNQQHKPRLAVLGTGTMGAPMAINLHRAGFPVTAWNRTADKTTRLAEEGLHVAERVTDAVRDADVVITIVKDADAVLRLLDDAEDAFATGAVLVQMSTIGAPGTEQVYAAAQRHGLRMVDAPVMGTKGPAENAQLVVLASCDLSLRDVAEPIFDTLGKATLWVSETPGDASKLKVVANSFIGTLTHAVAEAVRLAEGLGLDPSWVKKTLLGGPLESPFAVMKLDAILTGAFAPAFSIDNAVKDSRLVVDAAEAAGVFAPVAHSGLVRYLAAAEMGHGGQDMAASYFADDTEHGGKR